MLKALCGSQQTVENSERDGNTRPPDLPLRNLYSGQEVAVRTRHGAMDWFQIGKGVHQGCILSPCLFILYAEYIIHNVWLDESQAGIKIAGRNISNLRYADNTILYGREWRETKEPLDWGERGEWKSWLKTQHSKNEEHGIWSYHFMEDRWGNNDRLYFLRLQKSLKMVTAAVKLKDACSLEEKLWQI